jgi:hypothetical protein
MVSSLGIARRRRKAPRAYQIPPTVTLLRSAGFGITPAALPQATIAARLYSPDAAAAGYLEQVAGPAALDAAIAAALDPLLRLDAGADAKQRLRQAAIDRAAADLTPSAG